MASRGPAPVLLAEARRAWATLGSPARRAAWPAARDAYNAAVAKLFDQLRCGKGDWTSRAATMGTVIAAGDKDLFSPDTVDALFPAALVDVDDVGPRQTTGGIGLPVVGWRVTAPVGSRRPPFTLPTGLPYTGTAVLDFSHPGMPQWRMVKRWLNDDIRDGSVSQPLAADWSAANAFFWEMCDLDNLRIQSLLLPGRFSEETGLYFLQPYDPEKIPLVLVHGLASSPAAFRHTINALAPEPWFRKRYQIWLFNYPSGNPWPYSAAKFRELLEQARASVRTKGGARNLDRMVVIGHSMGGLITHASITDPGNALYNARFNQSFSLSYFTPAGQKLVRDTLLYRPLHGISRVIFLATPHRGSPAANWSLATWVGRLIRLPKALTIDLLDNTLQDVGSLVSGTARPQSSIGTLSPKDPVVLALGTRPLPRDVTCHSVIGRLGNGPLEKSSDGVVPYTSSHIEPVASEKIVSHWHSVQDFPDTNAEIRRILLLHLKDSH